MTAALVLGWDLNRHIAEPAHSSRKHRYTRDSFRKTCGTSLSCHCRNRHKSLRTCSSLHPSLPMTAALVLGWDLNRHIAEPAHSRRTHRYTRDSFRKTCGTSLSCHCRNRHKSLRTCSSLLASLPKEGGEERGASLSVSCYQSLHFGRKVHQRASRKLLDM
eukprot:TRINITY_DN9748_c0_g1_i2.p4 TRINITY_DN9748_c0_g1~~TRINITY_DN9748_c0_g1_i2.p4  ORF type:complete len:161 (-),score=10.24 TRINITY_DN9748_c0_g1_i2:270-752(-)